LMMVALVGGTQLFLYLAGRKGKKAERERQVVTEAAALVKRIEAMEEAEWCGATDVPVPHGPIG